VTISSRAAAIASGEGDCAPAGPAASKHMVRQAVRIHECLHEGLRMTALLAANGGSIPDRGGGADHSGH
jgi:hypothetical protein